MSRILEISILIFNIMNLYSNANLILKFYCLVTHKKINIIFKKPTS